MGRRPLPEHLKKHPSEYPQLAFRVSKKDKEKLLILASKITKAMNRQRKENDSYLTKGDVFVRALFIGFEQLRKNEKEENLIK